MKRLKETVEFLILKINEPSRSLIIMKKLMYHTLSTSSMLSALSIIYSQLVAKYRTAQFPCSCLPSTLPSNPSSRN